MSRARGNQSIPLDFEDAIAEDSIDRLVTPMTTSVVSEWLSMKPKTLKPKHTICVFEGTHRIMVALRSIQNYMLLCPPEALWIIQERIARLSFQVKNPRYVLGQPPMITEWREFPGIAFSWTFQQTQGTAVWINHSGFKETDYNHTIEPFGPNVLQRTL